MIFSYKNQKRKLKKEVTIILFVILLVMFTFIIIKYNNIKPETEYPYSYENWTEYVSSLEK